MKNLNPCIEIIGSYVINPDAIAELNVDIEKREQFRRELVEHLQTVGWEINHEWLDKIGKEKDPDGYDVLKRTIWGLHDGDYHLISKCGQFTVRIQKRKAVFWRKSPEWNKMTEISFKNIEFTERGIRYDDFFEIVIKNER